MSTVPPAPERAARRHAPRRGDRALAVRIIGETGARAARRPFAAVLHPPARWQPIRLGLDRAPRDIVRRGLRRIDRLVVRHAGRLLLALRRVDRVEAVQHVHRLDHRCFELEQRLESLETGATDGT